MEHVAINNTVDMRAEYAVPYYLLLQEVSPNPTVSIFGDKFYFERLHTFIFAYAINQKSFCR